MAKISVSHWWRQLGRRLCEAWRREPVACAIVVICLLVGGWLRFFRLSQTMMFLGDQGRDALTVSAIFRELDPVFIGPVTSVGNMYLGPFYYYFMLPFLLLTYPSPVGPALGVALVNTVAIFLMYYLGRRLVGQRAALVATILTTISAVTITYSRFSWNPNLSFLVSLLTLYAIQRSLTRSPKNWLWVGLLAGILIQLHYVNLIIVALAGCAWLFQWWSRRRDRHWLRGQFWPRSLAALGIFALTCAPLFLFDARHGWLNLQALGGIFSRESSFADDNVLVSVFASARGIFGRLGHLFTTLTFPRLESILADTTIDIYGFRVAWGVIILLLFTVFLLLVTWYRRHEQCDLGAAMQSWWSRITARDELASLTGLWLLWGGAVLSVVALAFYRHSVFDHYLLFFLPFLFLIYGYLLTRWPSVVSFTASVIFLIVFVIFNYQSGFYRIPDENIYNQQKIVRTIKTNLPEEQTYSVVLLDATRDYYGSNYRYFLSTLQPHLLSPEYNAQAQHLFIIDASGSANIWDTDVYEINSYPEATVASVLTLEDLPAKVYHLERLYE